MNKAKINEKTSNILSNKEKTHELFEKQKEKVAILKLCDDDNFDTIKERLGLKLKHTYYICVISVFSDQNHHTDNLRLRNQLI